MTGVRDRRAERVAAGPGRGDDGRHHHVAVVGGGLAGLAAATALAERGVRVTLFEREAQLGGRVRAWPVQHGADATTMSRGFHAFFRQYYNLRALLRRADPRLQRLVPLPDYPLLSADGVRDSFQGIPRTPPLNLIAFVLRSPSFGLRDLTKVDVSTALELVRVRFPETYARYDDESAAAFLDRLRFPPAARHLALEVFARSFFAEPERFSAGELIAMFHQYFVGSAEGLLFDVPDDDYDTALWAPLGRYLSRAEVDVRPGTAVTGLHSTADGVTVATAGGTLAADAAVVATELAVTRALLPPDGSEWRARLAALTDAPPFAVWRLWLDRPARPHRPAFLGTSGFGPVDNVSVVERYEAGAAEWAARHRGSVVELHAYALPEAATGPGAEAALRATMRGVLDRIYPEFAGATAVAEEWLVRADCPLLGVGTWRDRPDVSTPDPRVVLAGDGIRSAHPVALMERAATTGFEAANRLLAGWGLAGHELWTVPTTGLLTRGRRRGQERARSSYSRSA